MSSWGEIQILKSRANLCFINNYDRVIFRFYFKIKLSVRKDPNGIVFLFIDDEKKLFDSNLFFIGDLTKSLFIYYYGYTYLPVF